MACSDRKRRGPRELPPETDLLEYLLAVAPDVREEMVRSMGMTEADGYDADWCTWAHEGQQPPPKCADGSDWSTCVVMGGRGFGKTLAGAKWIEAAVARGGRLQIALVGATLAEARRVMVEGPTGLLEVAGPWIREWRPSLGVLKFRTGAEATLFSGHSPELLRGPQHDYAWCDELAKWEKAGETWDMLQLGLRVGERPRVIVTTTPRPGPVLRTIMAEPDCVVIGGASDANPHNSPVWTERIKARYAGTRLARQELGGELLTDNPGALWTEALLEKCRLDSLSPEGERGYVRLVIAVDPPSGDGTCGIIACARDAAGRAHVLADHSVTARSPEGWARAVADAVQVWGHLYPNVPVQVVAESNQGGLMVQSVLRIADAAMRIKLVPAVQGKIDRATPVAMLFEAGRAVLHGRFPELEAELCGMIGGGDYEGPGSSPDRADAMVWGLTELMLQKERAVPRITVL